MTDKKANKVDHPFLLDRRFEVRMTPEMEKLLNELAAQTGMTRAEILGDPSDSIS